ncbi:MAG: hypothetical protein PEGG_02178 [Paraeggerthella hongkongensis]
MPEFSFVIPVYNGMPYLESCLGSLLDQTFDDIEVICVDDCSTDGSLEALEAFSQRDSRVRVLRQPENRGSARARRRGVLASCGEYVLFSDQDDSYGREACEVVRQLLAERPVDILQYGTLVVNEGGVEQGEIAGLESWLEPYEGILLGRSILDECFVNLTFGYSIWNKAYRGELARRAFSSMEDVSVPLGEDNYESFVLFYFAETYRGVSRPLYRYHYGRGYTGHVRQTADSFRRTCGLSVAADLMKSFLISEGSFDEYEETYGAARRHMLRYTFDRWAVEVPDSDKIEALRYLLESWPYVEVLEHVAEDRPRDLVGLLNARFGSCDAEVLSAANGQELFDLMLELGELSRACKEKDDRIAARRQDFEGSRAYRVGRMLTSPLRRIRGE